MIILGDFNHNPNWYTIDNTDYSSTNFSPLSTQFNAASIRHKTSQQVWHELMTNNFRKCRHSRNIITMVPTFRSVRLSSTINYILASPILSQQTSTLKIDFINPDWTYHVTLSITFCFKFLQQGKNYIGSILIWYILPSLPVYIIVSLWHLNNSRLKRDTFSHTKREGGGKTKGVPKQKMD